MESLPHKGKGLNNEQLSGLLLISCTVISMFIANSHLGAFYLRFWDKEYGFGLGDIVLRKSILHWINDGLMTIFFLYVGLEIKKEILSGHLSHIKSAMLPVFGAFGGMLFPFLIYTGINYGSQGASGAGIPVATDIAFAIAALSLLGKRVPPQLRVFLVTLAVIDDLGAVIVIAVFYGSHFMLSYLGAALIALLVLLFLNLAGVKKMPVYILFGLLLWFFVMQSGIHATVAGVLLAFCIPRGKVFEKQYPAAWLEHWLQKPVNFVIMPLFALANTAIIVSGNYTDIFSSRIALGVIAGLVIGKPLGIILFSYLAVSLKAGRLPKGLGWKHLAGGGILGGIGFTMSIFMTMLSFSDSYELMLARIAIITASVIAGLAGYIYLSAVTPSAGHTAG
jgi:NhaA family Na+:H+ antiporter